MTVRVESCFVPREYHGQPDTRTWGKRTLVCLGCAGFGGRKHMLRWLAHSGLALLRVGVLQVLL